MHEVLLRGLWVFAGFLDAGAGGIFCGGDGGLGSLFGRFHLGWDYAAHLAGVDGLVLVGEESTECFTSDPVGEDPLDVR